MQDLKTPFKFASYHLVQTAYSNFLFNTSENQTIKSTQPTIMRSEHTHLCYNQWKTQIPLESHAPWEKLLIVFSCEDNSDPCQAWQTTLDSQHGHNFCIHGNPLWSFQPVQQDWQKIKPSLLAAATYLPVEVHVGEFVTQSLKVVWLHASGVCQDVVVCRSNGTLAHRLWDEEEIIPASTACIILASIRVFDGEVVGMGKIFFGIIASITRSQ